MSTPQKRTPGGSRANAEQSNENGDSVHEVRNAAQAEFWAQRIRTAHALSVEAIVQTGHELLQAKAALPHGEWGRLTGETTREPLLPFSSQMGQKLMRFAAHPDHPPADRHERYTKAFQVVKRLEKHIVDRGAK